MPSQTFNTCPFKPVSTIVPVGDTLPSHACTPTCAMFLKQMDPATGRTLDAGSCAFAVLAANVAQLRAMITIQAKPVPPAQG